MWAYCSPVLPGTPDGNCHTASLEAQQIVGQRFWPLLLIYLIDLTPRITLERKGFLVRPRLLALIFGILILAACGAYAPQMPTRSAVEARQTAVALQGRPTLAPVNITPAPSATPWPVDELLGITDDDPRALGDPNAPLTIVEFTDFECPFCQKFFQEARAQIISQYVDTGRVRLVVRDLPLSSIHPSAELGARAAQCAAAQGQFRSMYERLFSSHGSEWGGAPKRDHEAMIDFANELGLDEAAFSSCLDDPATAQAVADEAAVASRLRINGTPSFLIGGQMVQGALPFLVFSRLIEQIGEGK